MLPPDGCRSEAERRPRRLYEPGSSPETSRCSGSARLMAKSFRSPQQQRSGLAFNVTQTEVRLCIRR